MTFLTVLTVVPFELDDSYLRLYREALLRWNREGLAETQIILLPQGPLPDCDLSPFEVVITDFESVDGYPIWDVLRQIREAWPQVRGEYISVDHPEFIWGPGRLQNTIDWLSGYRPVYAVGNLRRAGSFEEITKLNEREMSQKPSLWFKGILESGQWDVGAQLFEYMSTMHWMYWKGPPQRPGSIDWVEDVFYIDKGWLDAWGFTSYERDLPFQDIWDLLQRAVKAQWQFGLSVDCVRMPMSVNKLRHLWHPRMRSNLTPEVRDWFLADPDRWGDSAFGNADLWDDLLLLRNNPQAGSDAVHELRNGPGGTAANYWMHVANWLNQGGVETLRKYYVERRERALR